MFEHENKMLRNITHNITTHNLYTFTSTHIHSRQTEKTRGSESDNILTLPFGGGTLGLAGTGSWAGFAGIGFLGSLKAYTKYLLLNCRTHFRNNP